MTNHDDSHAAATPITHAGGRRLRLKLAAAACVFALPLAAAILRSQGLSRLAAAATDTSGWLSACSLLGLGLLFGLKHALDADHLAAVSTLASERRGLLGSSLVGGLWGLGHTLALLAAGVAVLFLHLEITRRTTLTLEFGVAVMLIALGVRALWTIRRGGHVHLHAHRHGERVHLHPHIHDHAPPPAPHGHHALRHHGRPFLVGMLHGLAGSAAVMLLVLSTISSPALGLAYIGVFGLGSIGGMMFMSLLLGLPAHLTASRFNRANLVVRTLAAVFSIGLGLSMAYTVGIVEGLFL